MRNESYPSPSHYSADVTMYLQVNGQQIEVAGCLENRCTLRRPTQLDPCEADFVLVIDGRVSRKRVFLLHGISDSSPIVEFTPTESDSHQLGKPSSRCQKL